MTPDEARKMYYQKYRNEHRAEINAKTRQWRESNKERLKAYNKSYWERKAEEYNNSCNG